MRKAIPFLILLAALLLLPAAALAQTYSFADIHASVEVDESDWDVVLTPYNLNTNSAWLAENSLDFDAEANSFEAEGILLKAVDTKNSRTLIITAVEDVDSKMYFDLNNQDEDMRKEFRLGHRSGASYRILGYNYSSAAWKNYGGTTLRFLQTKYTLNQEGESSAGYQRRTIRNGYTITLDMWVTGRSARESDDTALEKVMKTFKFTEVLPMPPLPVKLTFSSEPPTETSSDTVTLKGTTARKAEVTATVISLGASGSQTYTDTASSSGAFSIKITLPAQGVYSVTVSSQKEGELPNQRIFSLTYQKGLLPVNLTATPGSVLSDETVISGTTISGAKTQLSVSGPVTVNKSTTSSSFNFKIDTSAEGTYTFVLAVTKKDMNERSFTYTATRSYSEGEKLDKIRSSAKNISYANLAKASNEGKYVYVTGYLLDVETSINEWVAQLATSRSGENYKNIVYLICTEEPTFETGAKVTVYGTATGTYSKLIEGGTIETYPRVEAAFFEAAD